MTATVATEPDRAAPATPALACLYCGSTALAPLYEGVRDRLGHVPGGRTFRRCTRCDSAVLDPLPTTAELPGFYPPVYSFAPDLGRGRFKRLLSTAEYHFYFRPQYTAQTRRVVRACGWKRGDGKKLLDVGCGRGLRLLEFRRLGFEVHGMDVQPEVARHLRDDLGIPAEAADVTAVTRLYPPATFDLVTTFFLIEHVPDVRAALAGMFALLKPGGWLAAAVPFGDSVQAGVFGARWINVTEAPRHLSIPTRRGMTAACRGAGFDRVTVVPDSALNCAGLVGSSLIPGATVTHLYGRSGLGALFARAVGAGVMAAAVPWCLFENHALGRPGLGIAMARKPPAGGG